jgi:L-threonylcarbamoyladenylate synthase
VKRVRLEDVLSSESGLFELRRLLADGGVAAVPTETFYALAADPANDRGVARVFEIKGRDDGKPLLVLFSNRDHLDRLGLDAPEEILDPFFRIWPAPLTVVLPLALPIPASRGRRDLAIRMPASPAVRKLLDAVGPLTGTSANRSGASPLADPDAVAAALGAEVDLLIDGGRTPGGVPSTIVDATGEPPVVLRLGAFPWPPCED